MSKTDFKSLKDALDDLEDCGFTSTFEPDGVTLRSRETGRVYDADEIVIVKVYRFEGETDPQDMSVVYALEGKDGERGTVVDAFGAYGSPDVGEAMKNVKTCRAS